MQQQDQVYEKLTEQRKELEKKEQVVIERNKDFDEKIKELEEKIKTNNDEKQQLKETNDELKKNINIQIEKLNKLNKLEIDSDDTRSIEDMQNIGNEKDINQSKILQKSETDSISTQNERLQKLEIDSSTRSIEDIVQNNKLKYQELKNEIKQKFEEFEEFEKLKEDSIPVSEQIYFNEIQITKELINTIDLIDNDLSTLNLSKLQKKLYDIIDKSSRCTSENNKYCDIIELFKDLLKVVNNELNRLSTTFNKSRISLEAL